jgi:VanZ family protein
LSRARFGLAAFFYGLLVLYASTLVGPMGINFVSIGWDEALNRLLDLRYVSHGSDQRADWMGNVTMAVPLGILVAGTLSSARVPGQKPRTATIAAFLLCAIFIVGVKYLQIFFPPRTVTLNYIAAQSLGAIIGIAVFAVMRLSIGDVTRGFRRLESLRMALLVYTALLILFMLMPLDFALSADDLAAQLAKLPDTLTALNGEDRPLRVWLAVTLAGIVSTAPVGALLTLTDRSGRLYLGRSTSAAAWAGLFLMLIVYALTTLVISGSASLPTVAFRTIGIALGAWSLHFLTRQDSEQVHDELGALVPWAVPIYLLTLFSVNGLLSFDWIGAEQAERGLYGLGLLPLFNYYIVTKAQAAKNIIGHVVMYAPIGVMIWLRVRHGTGRGTSFFLAVLLSAIVETGRFFRPGLVPDINAVPLAGIAAWTAAALMPVLWQMLSAVTLLRATQSRTLPLEGGDTPVVNWRDRRADRHCKRRERTENRGTAIGEVEDY